MATDVLNDKVSTKAVFHPFHERIFLNADITKYEEIYISIMGMVYREIFILYLFVATKLIRRTRLGEIMKRIAIVLILLIMGISIIGCGSGPEQATETFLKAFTELDANTLYDLLPEEQREGSTPEEIEKNLTDSLKEGGMNFEYSELQIKKIDERGDYADAYVQSSKTGGTMQIPLIKENGEWKVDWFNAE